MHPGLGDLQAEVALGHLVGPRLEGDELVGGVEAGLARVVPCEVGGRAEVGVDVFDQLKRQGAAGGDGADVDDEERPVELAHVDRAGRLVGVVDDLGVHLGGKTEGLGDLFHVHG